MKVPGEKTGYIARMYYGSSMSGTFREGDCLYIRKVSLSHLKRGDVIAYVSKRSGLNIQDTVHRVVALFPGGVATRGDNSPPWDIALVPEDKIIGRVIFIERGGRKIDVHGGVPGWIRARVLHCYRRVMQGISWSLRWPVYIAWNLGSATRLWNPPLRKIAVHTPRGSYVKFAVRNRTVALWWPDKNKLKCFSPYDLWFRRCNSLSDFRRFPEPPGR